MQHRSDRKKNCFVYVYYYMCIMQGWKKTRVFWKKGFYWSFEIFENIRLEFCAVLLSSVMYIQFGSKFSKCSCARNLNYYYQNNRVIQCHGRSEKSINQSIFYFSSATKKKLQLILCVELAEEKKEEATKREALWHAVRIKSLKSIKITMSMVATTAWWIEKRKAKLLKTEVLKK